MVEPIAVPVGDPSRVGEARRAASAMADVLGFDEAGRGRVALAVTEAATNLVRHGGGGELVLVPGPPSHGDVLDVLALDNGPGMDVARCLADGYSTAGSSGNGLGAIRRLADAFDLDSAPDRGTALLARFRAGPPPRAPGPGRLEVGAVCLPKPGQPASGDAWAVAEAVGRSLLLVADGLGHGPQAAHAARETVRIFHEAARLGPAGALQAAHAALRATRGAVAAVAEVDPAARSIRFAGVGNIAGAVVAPGGASQSLVSMNGTLGHEARRFQEFTYPWPAGATLVLHSDGLAGHWRLDRYPGLIGRDPSLVAGVLYRDFARGRDDVTVVVARDMQGGGSL